MCRRHRHSGGGDLLPCYRLRSVGGAVMEKKKTVINDRMSFKPHFPVSQLMLSSLKKRRVELDVMFNLSAAD